MVETTKKLEINISQLEHESAVQAKYFGESGAEYAAAEYAHRNARLNRDKVKAEIEMEVRKNPASFGLDKVTDKSVEAALTLSPLVQEAEHELANAERQANEAKAIRDAWQQRGALLKAEVDLWTSNYFTCDDASDLEESERQLRGKKTK